MAKTNQITQDITTSRNRKPSDQEQVVEYINRSDHPLKAIMKATREVILDANPQMTEHIKWNAPSFCFNGEDRVTFNLHNEAYLLLVFHRGAKVKDRQANGTLVEDTTGLLEWVTQDRANVKLYSLQDLESKAESLAKAVNQWVVAAG